MNLEPKESPRTLCKELGQGWFLIHPSNTWPALFANGPRELSLHVSHPDPIARGAPTPRFLLLAKDNENVMRPVMVCEELTPLQTFLSAEAYHLQVMERPDDVWRTYAVEFSSIHEALSHGMTLREKEKHIHTYRIVA